MIQEIITNLGALNPLAKNCERSGRETEYSYRNSNTKGERAYKQDHSYDASHDDYDQNKPKF